MYGYHLSPFCNRRVSFRLLRSAYDPAGFNNTQLDFPVYVANEFLTAMDEGISASALSDLSRRIAAYAAGAFAI